MTFRFRIFGHDEIFWLGFSCGAAVSGIVTVVLLVLVQ